MDGMSGKGNCYDNAAMGSPPVSKNPQPQRCYRRFEQFPNQLALGAGFGIITFRRCIADEICPRESRLFSGSCEQPGKVEFLR
jgi:hypothetical protein